MNTESNGLLFKDSWEERGRKADCKAAEEISCASWNLDCGSAGSTHVSVPIKLNTLNTRNLLTLYTHYVQRVRRRYTTEYM